MGQSPTFKKFITSKLYMLLYFMSCAKINLFKLQLSFRQLQFLLSQFHFTLNL